MKKSTYVVTGIILMVGGTILPVADVVNPDAAVIAIAATNGKIQRNHLWKKGIKHRDYKVANTKGKTYTFSGPMNNIKMKVNHNLKNYKKSTWIRKGIVQIKKNGNWMMYYYVTTKKNKASGWVKLTDMKLKYPHKTAKHVQPEFDVWYRNLNQTQRNEYHNFVYTGATDADGSPAEW